MRSPKQVSHDRRQLPADEAVDAATTADDQRDGEDMDEPDLQATDEDAWDQWLLDLLPDDDELDPLPEAGDFAGGLERGADDDD